MKLTWITDVHLNFLQKDERIDFYHTLFATDSNGVVISGDIAEATSIELILKEIASTIQKPIYFVLGNHDYYRGSINDLRSTMMSHSYFGYQNQDHKSLTTMLCYSVTIVLLMAVTVTMRTAESF